MNKLNISVFKNKKILLLCHENADLDTFCSAAIFKDFLKQKKISAKIGVPSHINEQTLSFAFENKISFTINPDIEIFDLICIFDFNDFEQLGILRNKFSKLILENKIKVIAFDHHVKEKRSIASGFIDSKKLSTTQLLFDLLNKNFNNKMSFFACLGMVEDTGRFLVGNSDFFNTFAKCLSKSKKTYAQVFAVSKHVMPESEKVAFLKAIKRAKIIKINKIILITSVLGFYQGAAATKLLEFGAHISLVVGKEKEGMTHLSARAETLFKEKNKFNLMTDLMIPLQKIVFGDVGGHSGAAQWKGIVSEKVVLKEAIKILEKKLLK